MQVLTGCHRWSKVVTCGHAGAHTGVLRGAQDVQGNQYMVKIKSVQVIKMQKAKGAQDGQDELSSGACDGQDGKGGAQLLKMAIKSVRAI